MRSIRFCHLFCLAQKLCLVLLFLKSTYKSNCISTWEKSSSYLRNIHTNWRLFESLWFQHWLLRERWGDKRQRTQNDQDKRRNKAIDNDQHLAFPRPLPPSPFRILSFPFNLRSIGGGGRYYSLARFSERKKENRWGKLETLKFGWLMGSTFPSSQKEKEKKFS